MLFTVFPHAMWLPVCDDTVFFRLRMYRRPPSWLLDLQLPGNHVQGVSEAMPGIGNHNFAYLPYPSTIYTLFDEMWQSKS